VTQAKSKTVNVKSMLFSCNRLWPTDTGVHCSTEFL